MASPDLRLKSTQAEIAQRLRASVLPFRDFKYEEKSQGNKFIATLKYKPNVGYEFNFHSVTGSDDEWSADYSPGKDRIVGVGGPDKWPWLLDEITQWTNYIARELAVADPWAELAEAEPQPLTSGPIDNSPLPEPEQAQVIERIEQLRTYLLDSEVLNEQDRHLIIDRLNYLADGVPRLGRFDWRGLAVATVIDLAILGYVDREMVRQTVDFLVGTAQRLLS